MLTLTFFGGAKTVTGANYLLEEELPDHSKTRILIDCGLQQGSYYSDRKNFEPFPYDPSTIDALLITHAHIDHTGCIPKLVKQGFKGTIFSTPPTKDCAEHLLIDSENLLRKEAEERKLPPLYTIEDVNHALGIWHKIPYHQKIQINSMELEFYDAGHTLGSSFIVINTKEKKRIVFSGDLGNSPMPLVKEKENLPRADYVVLESTYGNRIHEGVRQRKRILKEVLKETIQRKGVLLMPAFAMERTQQILYEMNDMVENNEVPRISVFMDSPLAIKLTSIYKKYSENPDYMDGEALSHTRKGDAIFDFPGLVFTLTTEQSKAINDASAPKIIIAGSGMSQGGRILHHEYRYLSDAKNTILFIGYQAKNSRGREILDGAKMIPIFGEKIPILCNVRLISGYSSHADQTQLIRWVEPKRTALQKIFLVQGEEEAMLSLAQKIETTLRVNTMIPSSGNTIVL